MEFEDTPDEAAFRRDLRAWLDDTLPRLPWPEPAPLEEKLPFWRLFQDQVRAAGYAGISWPREYGGRGAGVMEQAIYAEELDRAGAPWAMNGVGEGFAGPTIIEFGTEEQKERYLPKILSGEEIWCQLFSEPGAGSDLASLSTKAVRDGDGWRISGQKVWTSRAQVSDLAICLARTGGPRHSGITYFLFPMHQDGVTVRPIKQLTGETEFSEVFLEDAYVPDENVLGAVDDGWRVARATLQYERVAIATGRINVQRAFSNLLELIRETEIDGRPAGEDQSVRRTAADLWMRTLIHRLNGARSLTSTLVVEPDPSSSAAAHAMRRQLNPGRCGNAAIALGIARAALERAISYARERRRFGRDICEYQGIQWKLADMATRFDAARLVLMRAAASDEDGLPATRLAMQARIASTEAAECICREAMQIHGRRGFTRDLPVERFYREARGTAVGGGSVEIDRNVLAAEVLGRRSAAHASTADADPRIPSLLPPLPTILEALRERTAAVASANAEDAARWDEEEVFPEPSFERLRSAGLCGIILPEAYGGEGLGVLEGCIVLEELAATCMSSAMIAQVYLNGPPRALLTLGTEEQRRRLLPSTAAGEHLWGIAISEPEAGSAATQMTTRLEPDGDGFRLHGGKCYITGGMRADIFLVFCRLAGTQDARGIGAVILRRDQPGFADPRTQPKMGGRGIGEAVLGFDGIRIDARDVVVAPDPDSSRGAAIMLRQFNPERCGNAAMCIGLARAALADSLLHVRTRRQFGRELAEFQGLQWRIADMALELDAARELVHRAAASEEVPGHAVHGDGEDPGQRGGPPHLRPGDPAARPRRILPGAAARAVLPRRPWHVARWRDDRDHAQRARRRGHRPALQPARLTPTRKGPSRP